MRRLIPIATALLVIQPQSVLAQDHHHGGGEHHGGASGGGEHHGGPAGGEHHGGRPDGGGNSHHDGGPHEPHQVDAAGAARHEQHDQHSQFGAGHDRAIEGGNFDRGPREGYAHGYSGRPQGWSRASDFRPVHAPRFYYPHGYGYRRWRVGLLLPGLFLAPAYYYSSWAGAGAYRPPYGDRWVRYGPDLLLVNVRSGRIDDVIYGAFY